MWCIIKNTRKHMQSNVTLNLKIAVCVTRNRIKLGNCVSLCRHQLWTECQELKAICYYYYCYYVSGTVKWGTNYDCGRFRVYNKLHRCHFCNLRAVKLFALCSFFPLKTGSVEEDPYTFVSFKALYDYDHKEARICYNVKSVFKLT